MTSNDPIVVNPSQMPEQIGAVLRYALTSLGGYLVARGTISGETLQTVIAVLMIVVPYAYAAYRTNVLKKQLTTTAAAAPNYVAVVKGS